MRSKIVKRAVWSIFFIMILFVFSFWVGVEKTHASAKEDKDKMPSTRVLGRAFVEVAKKVQPSVVNISTEKTVSLRPWERGDDFFQGKPF